MNRSLLARMFFAVAVMAAALLLAPTSSFAHAGHAHGSATTEVNKRIADLELNGTDDSARAIAKQQIVMALLPGLLDKAEIVCTGGCCSAASASCCAISVPTLLSLLDPPFGRAVFATVQCEGAGIVPGTLPKPPKSLV